MTLVHSDAEGVLVPTAKTDGPAAQGHTPGAAWAKFKNDFDAMTDDQINDETRRSQDALDEAEEWLEAVAAWKAAGSPRAKATAQASPAEQVGE